MYPRRLGNASQTLRAAHPSLVVSAVRLAVLTPAHALRLPAALHCEVGVCVRRRSYGGRGWLHCGGLCGCGWLGCGRPGCSWLRRGVGEAGTPPTAGGRNGTGAEGCAGDRSTRGRGTGVVLVDVLSCACSCAKGRPAGLGAGHLPLWEITCAPTGEAHRGRIELPWLYERPLFGGWPATAGAAWCVRCPGGGEGGR